MQTIIITAMLAMIVVPIIALGVMDAKRHPWGK
jgi:hypothetical protein